MKIRKLVSSALVAGIILSVVPTSSLAIGGSSGPHLDYAKKGELGYVQMDPYGYAPLTAVITTDGYELKDVHVKIVPKKGGQVIEYDVDDMKVKQHAGIPVFGLYADHRNTVEVKYTKIFNGKEKTNTATYKFYAPPVYQTATGRPGPNKMPFSSVDVKKVDSKFKDRLYFVNNIQGKVGGHSSKMVWNNPMGGALEWNYHSNAFIVDTQGEVRWYLNADKLIDENNIYKSGIMMGFKQNKDGAISWGYGQRYAKFNIMGEKIFNRRLPQGYIDYSHSMDETNNGDFLLRVASANHKRPDGKNVRTVRDVVIEVDAEGKLIEEWKLFDILDPYRDVALKALDQGAVCLNVDANSSGHTLSAEDLAKLDASDKFGDIVGSGAGRNWAHVNSVDHDPNDDSLIVSVRHQSAAIKVDRNKKVKWILGAHDGWKKEFKDKLLTPVDSKGKKISCEDGMSQCPGYTGDNGGFDWSWTQHTAYIIDSKSNKDIVYLSVFDNGDARGNEQPAIATMKYSRAVIYKIDQKKMTVQQVWEYGKDRGMDWFSPITSSVEYQKDKNSVMVYSATAGMQFDVAKGKPIGAAQPEIDEFVWGKKEPAVQMRFKGAGSGYQAWPFNVKKAFGK